MHAPFWANPPGRRRSPAPAREPRDHFALRTRTVLAIGLVSTAPTVVTLWPVSERLRRLGPLYGAFFTAAFAAVYMPTLLRWRGRARQLVDAVCRTPNDGKPDEAWTKGRAALEQLLGINIGIMAQLSGMLAVFGPS